MRLSLLAALAVAGLRDRLHLWDDERWELLSRRYLTLARQIGTLAEQAGCLMEGCIDLVGGRWPMRRAGRSASTKLGAVAAMSLRPPAGLPPDRDNQPTGE